MSFCRSIDGFRCGRRACACPRALGGTPRARGFFACQVISILALNCLGYLRGTAVGLLAIAPGCGSLDREFVPDGFISLSPGMRDPCILDCTWHSY